MYQVATEDSDLSLRVPTRRTRQPAPRRRIHLGWKRDEPGDGVRQAVVDRELTWRPALRGVGFDRLGTEAWTTSGSRCSEAGGRVVLSNAGGSPAIGARYVYRHPESGWFLSTPVDVPAHDAETEVVSGQPVSERVAHTLLGSIGATDVLAGAIFCCDFLTRRWCFPISDSERDVTLEAIVWRRGAHAPEWASSPALWAPPST